MKKIPKSILIPIVICLAFVLWRMFPLREDLPKKFGTIEWKFSPKTIELEDLSFTYDENQFVIRRGEKNLWSTSVKKAFLGASTGKIIFRDRHGSYQITFRNRLDCEKQVIEEFFKLEKKIILKGSFICQRENKAWEWVFEKDQNKNLSFSIQADSSLDRIYARFFSSQEEHFFGTGEQFTHFDLKGHRVPVWVSEQGIGRGLQPITAILNLLAGSGGDAYATYISSPLFVSTKNRALILKNYEYGEFDFRNHEEIIFDYWSSNISGILLDAQSPKNLLTKTTEYTGRMRTLPDWIHKGPILGAQGGRDHIQKILTDFEDLRFSGLWLQDWVGQRKTIIGKQLWWSWDLDKKHYPNWDHFLEKEQSGGTNFLGYINPFFVDPPNKERKNYRSEGLEKNFFVRDKEEKFIEIKVTDFATNLLDLSNVNAVTWVKEIIKKELIGNGFWGWMADFGEAAPLEGFYRDKNPISFHNQYPVEWAKLNREAIEEVNNSKNLTFFMRSGFLESPKYATLFWTGDQLVTWDQYDGMRSSLTALLSSGISGFTLNHSDIGGYTSFKLPFFSYIRSKELLIRWMEMNAFTLIFRSHEGNQPENNIQIYSDAEIRKEFTKNAEIYSSLFLYRKKLIQDASEKGWPVVRPMWLEFPEEKEIITSDQQFLLGDRLLVAPVFFENQTTVNIFFPKGKWKHFSTGEVLDLKKSNWLVVDAPLGRPAAYWRILD
ncbi:MAG: alpha-glucosidase [Oligoflexia bacterium]|nr:alpha-glucosidase [Oligoflexia bacterium]